MPLPQRLARFNRRVTNPIANRVAGRVPPLAIIVHTGRRSGRTYRTPVMAFRDAEGGFVVALTYGSETDWVRNVLAAGGCELVRGGQPIRLEIPRVNEPADPPGGLPTPVRWALGLLKVRAYLRMSPRQAPHGPNGS